MKPKSIIYITEKCNLHCPFCYVKKHGNEMSTEVADKIINYYNNKEEKTANFVLMGGETLLSLDLTERFIHELYHEDIETFAIMTNGTIPVRKLNERLAPEERKKVFYNISIKDIDRPYLPNLKENFNYLREHHLPFTLLTVNTPENIEKLEKFIDFAVINNASGATILRQHMMGDYWTEKDVRKYKPVLMRLLHRYLYYKEKIPTFQLSMPNKPFLSIDEGTTSYKKYGINIVNQDSFCQYKIVGMDGHVYHCDGACGQKTHSYGYLWEERPNPWIREFGYQDALYDYCELAKNKVFLPFDQLNDECRKKYKKIWALITILKNEANS